MTGARDGTSRWMGLARLLLAEERESGSRFFWLCGRCARGVGKLGIASEIWISGGKREILGFGPGETLRAFMGGGPWAIGLEIGCALQAPMGREIICRLHMQNDKILMKNTPSHFFERKKISRLYEVIEQNNHHERLIFLLHFDLPFGGHYKERGKKRKHLSRDGDI